MSPVCVDCGFHKSKKYANFGNKPCLPIEELVNCYKKLFKHLNLYVNRVFSSPVDESY